MVRDLTQGSLYKKILKYSYPLIISNILQVLFNLSDIAVVGKFGSSTALGSVGSTTILVTLFLTFLIGMGSGVNVLVARYYGAHKERELSETVHTSLLICLLAGLLIMTVGVISAHPILKILRTKKVLMDGAVCYLKIYFLGMPAIALYNFGNAVFSAIGETKKPLYYLSVAGVLNVILNLFFVIVCKMDVAGVATASVISQYLSAFLIVRDLFQCNQSYGLKFRLNDNKKNSNQDHGNINKKINNKINNKISRTKALTILSLGITSGFQNAIFQIANLFIQFGVNTFNATMVSGNSAATNADALVYEVMGAFYIACSSFIGQNYGAGKKDRMKKSYLICLAYSFGVGAIIGILLEIFGREFLSLFTGRKAVVDAGMNRLVIMGFSYAFSAFMDCTIAAARGIGKVLVPTIIVFLGSCVFRIIWIYTIFAHFNTIQSLYLLYIFSWSITALLEMLYFKIEFRKCVMKI